MAALGIQARLEEAGWTTMVAQLPNNIVACKGNGATLFLAHSDTVPGSPGTIDNAVGVATLLELARTTTASDLCLGFPAQEEIGLIGSRQMVEVLEKWHPNASDLGVVLALDLVGHGTLSITGLGQRWGQNQLQWLYEHASIHSEYGYQVVSRTLPSNERSDHAPFTDNGYLAAHLLGRNKDGIFPAYHQPTDTDFDPSSVTHLISVLESIATASDTAPQHRSPLDDSVVLMQQVVPGWLVWGICLVSIASGISRSVSLWSLCFGLLKTLGVLVLLGILSNLLLYAVPFQSTPIEQNVLRVVGLPANGWWNAAPWIALVFLSVFLLIHWSGKVRGDTKLIGALSTLLLLFMDPILAFPMAVATLCCRLWSPLIVLGGIYWIQPAILRELSFHGLIPPTAWVLCTVFLIPTLFSQRHVQTLKPS